MKDLFGIETSQGAKTKVRASVLVHKQLVDLYGAVPDTKCGKCKFFYFNDGRFPKCELSGLHGHSFNQDWSSRWQACGRFEKE